MTLTPGMVASLKQFLGLDGFFGRSTAMAVLCWPDTNPYLQLENRYRAMPPNLVGVPC